MTIGVYETLVQYLASLLISLLNAKNGLVGVAHSAEIDPVQGVVLRWGTTLDWAMTITTITCILILHQNHKIPLVPGFSFTLWFLTSVIISLALFTGASFVRGRLSFPRIISSYGFAYLPLTFAGHIAFQVPFMQEGLRWLTGSTGAGTNGSDPILIESVLISIGLLWSLWILKKLSKKADWLITAVHGVLLLLFGVSLFIVLRI